MSVLPNNTLANPYVSFYAPLGGGGAANSLQSPASITPDAALGDAILNVDSAGGASFAALTVRGGATGDGDIGLGGGGHVYDFKASGLNGNLSITATPSQPNQTDILRYSTASNTLSLGDSLGTVVINEPLVIQGAPPNGNSVVITSVSTTTGSIVNGGTAANTLQLGSSSNATNTLQLVDGGGGSAKCLIGGNGGTGLVISGGVLPDPTGVGVTVRTDAVSSGVMTIGSSIANPTTMFVKDTGAAGTGFVDVAGGVYNSIALRLQGANSQVGANQAKISTNNVDAQSPILNISNSVDGTPKMVVTSLGTTINGTENTITGDTTFTTGNCIVKSVLSFGQTGGFNTGGVNVGAIEAPNIYTSFGVAVSSGTTVPIPQPTGTGGVPMETGLYLVLTNGTIGGLPSASCYISSHAYWTGTAWSVGGGGAAPALVSPPPSYCGIQADGGGNLILANGSGLGVATINVYFIQLYGYLGL